MTRRFGPALLGAAMLVLVEAPSALALIGDTVAIRAAAVVRSRFIEQDNVGVALLGVTPTHTHQLILRTISRQNGALMAPDQVVTLLDGVMPVDVMFSTVFRPDSILVLDDMLRVHEWPVAFDAFGRAKLVGTTPTIHGPFGDTAVLGAGTALAEAPRGLGPNLDPFLGIGTSSGRLVLTTGIVDAADYLVDLGKGEITGLATVPQVGGFAFVAAHNGQAVGVSTGGGSSPPSVIFQLADPRPDPLLDLSTGAVFEPNDEHLTSPAPVSFVAANGTTNVAVLQIPADPTMGGTLKVGIVVVGACPIARVDLGSLVMVEADGDAVLYDPGFNLASGPSGITLTLAGASVDLDPNVLNLGSPGKFVTASIEVEDGHAADIDAGTVTLGLSCDAVDALKASINPAPQLGDADEDGQADLTVKFDRAALAALLSSLPEGPTSLAARWTYSDGSSACGVSVMHIKTRTHHRG